MMNDDTLSTYQKYVALSTIHNNEKPADADLLKCSYYKRHSTYLAYLQTISSCSNQTTCLVLEQKLKEYSTMIDNRKGINNFASVAKALAKNVTNVSKKWTSGLESSISDVSIKKFLKCNEGGTRCENLSAEVCCAAIPSQQHVDHFFSTLSKLKQCKAKSTSPPQFASYSHHSDGEKKKSSLYSTYEDPVLDQMRSKTNVKFPSTVIQQRLNFKGTDDRNESKLWKSTEDKFSTKRLNPSDNKTVKRYNPPVDNFFSKRNIAQPDENAVSMKYSNADKIKKMSKFLNEDGQDERKQLDVFKTASEALKIQSQVRHGGAGANQYGGYSSGGGGIKKSLGGKGRSSANRFVPPLRTSQEEDSDMLITRSVLGRPGPGSSNGARLSGNTEPEDERLSHIDPKMIELIRSEIMDHGAVTTWDDIAGLEFAKHTIQEIVVWPMLRPDIFTGLRAPPKGILLFGPPGTGKTLIGKCIASQSKSTFFSISASSLTSKWIGDGEKMVRALFAVARVEQPSVVFIDEIDSLLSQRSDQEHESSRRIKTEFLVQLDGAATGEEDRLLIIGATNRPQELDEAARRRLVKRLYIPLPDFMARKQLVTNLMSKERNDLMKADLDEIARLTEGYSGADMKNLCQEASLGPIRSISASLIAHINPDQVRSVNIDDFKQALKRVRSSVSSKDLDLYIEWDKQFGMSS